jgi:hypothetical protein
LGNLAKLRWIDEPEKLEDQTEDNIILYGKMYIPIFWLSLFLESDFHELIMDGNVIDGLMAPGTQALKLAEKRKPAIARMTAEPIDGPWEKFIAHLTPWREKLLLIDVEELTWLDEGMDAKLKDLVDFWDRPTAENKELLTQYTMWGPAGKETRIHRVPDWGDPGWYAQLLGFPREMQIASK